MMCVHTLCVHTLTEQKAVKGKHAVATNCQPLVLKYDLYLLSELC